MEGGYFVDFKKLKLPMLALVCELFVLFLGAAVSPSLLLAVTISDNMKASGRVTAGNGSHTTKIKHSLEREKN